MAIDKALYAAPQGIDQLEEGPEIEIEIVDDDEMTESPEEKALEAFDANLAEDMNEGELAHIVGCLLYTSPSPRD